MMNTAKNLDFEEEKAETTTTENIESKTIKGERTSLRRHGIEVDKVEDVGITVMSGKYPTKCMTMEEYLSIPEEIREKANTEMKYVFDNARTLFPIAVKKALKEQLEMGVPISYSDGNGKVLRRYPDGKIFLADVDMETFEKTETFLRMATPEDDVGIYD